MRYSELIETYDKIESISGRLQKTQYVSELLKTVKDEDIEEVMLLIQGRIFPQWDSRTIGIASQLVLKSLAIATGFSSSEIEAIWRQNIDLGNTAEELIKKKKQVTLFSEPLTVRKVFDNLRKAAEAESQGSVDKKIQLIAELLTSASPKEAKYIIRTTLEELRIGLGEGTIRDAIAWSVCNAELKEGEVINELNNTAEWISAVAHAYERLNDFAKTIKTARKGIEELKGISLIPNIPVKVMLFQKAESIEDGLKIVGAPCAIEYKYDGFRVQIHKDREITIFTRRLENVTKQFPDVVNAAKQVKADSFILDAEVVGISEGKYLAFQNISTRIKRKYDIEAIIKKFPVEVNVFDILYLDGKSLIDLPFNERRKHIEGIIPKIKGTIQPSEQQIASTPEEVEKFYKTSLSAGNEGIMMKNLTSVYQPGARVGFGMKIKPTMETLEVVIVGAEWGEGKRAEWLSSFILAVKDENDNLVEIGRMGTGLKEKPEEGFSFKEMTELLKPIITEDRGREVRVTPNIIIEVDYEEIQQSPTYSSGFALRFPRFVKLREDRSTDDIASISDIRNMYYKQRGRNNQIF